MRIDLFHDDLDPRIDAAFEWIVALDAYDHACREPLAALMAGDKTIPTELRPAIAKILGGQRRPNKKAAAKLKLPASERLLIAGTLSTVIGLANWLKSAEIYDFFADDGKMKVRKAIDIAADKSGVEPIQTVRFLEEKVRSAVRRCSEHYGVSIETVENLLRDLRKKLENYPNV